MSFNVFPGDLVKRKAQGELHTTLTNSEHQRFPTVTHILFSSHSWVMPVRNTECLAVLLNPEAMCLMHPMSFTPEDFVKTG